MNETLHTLALEILKTKYNLSDITSTDAYWRYREIYAELQQAERDYLKENPGVKFLK